MIDIGTPNPTNDKLTAKTTVDIDGKEYEVFFVREEVIGMGHVDFEYTWPEGFPEEHKQGVKDYIEGLDTSDYGW